MSSSEWSKRQAPSLAEFEAIADAAFARLPRRFRDLCKDVVIRVEDFATDEVLDFLGHEGYDPTFGARPLKRVLQRMVLNELSKDILAGTISKDSVVEAVLEDDKIKFKNLDVAFPRPE